MNANIFKLYIFGIGLQAACNMAVVDAICQIVQRHGAECQVHRVETIDGYQLTMQRIPPPRNQSCHTFAQHPFVLMHGLIGSAADFVAAGRARALALLLHAHCYDVWLPNARGTTQSRQHRTLSASQKAFWDFSWHEIGVYDLPAIVEHVLHVTGHQRIHYVGHSQGTTVLLVLLSQRPGLNNRFATVSFLAPIAYLQNLSSLPLRLLASDTAGITMLLNQLNLHELLPATSLTQVGGPLLCSPALPTYALCTLITSLYVGFSEYPLDRNIFPRILETTPAGISRGQLLHYGQLINSGKFQQFDYRSSQVNIEHYGQRTPPSYQLQNIRINMTLFYGNRDALSSRMDVRHLVRELINCRINLFQVRGYNHIDFLYADSAPQKIYKQIIQKASFMDGIKPITNQGHKRLFV